MARRRRARLRLGPAGLRPDLRRPGELADVLRPRRPGRRDICIYAARPARAGLAGCPTSCSSTRSHTYRLRFADGRPPPTPAPDPRASRCARWRRRRRRRDEPDLRALRDGARAGGRAVGQPPAPTAILTTWSPCDDDDRARSSAPSPASTTSGLRRPGERLQPVDAGRRPDAAARHRCGADCGAGRAVRDRGRAYVDLSVLARQRGGDPALREARLRTAFRCSAVKRKNAINEPLFTPGRPETVDDLNPYARIIADEAMRRGIRVEVLDAAPGRAAADPRRPHRHHPRVAVGVHLRGGDEPLRRQARHPADRHRGRARRCRAAGSPPATTDDHAFLEEVGDVVVKPTRGEQGKGITVGVERTAEALDRGARARAARHLPGRADRGARARRGPAGRRHRRQGGGRRRPPPAEIIGDAVSTPSPS